MGYWATFYYHKQPIKKYVLEMKDIKIPELTQEVKYYASWNVLRIAIAFRAYLDLYLYKDYPECIEYVTAWDFIKSHADKDYVREARRIYEAKYNRKVITHKEL